MIAEATNYLEAISHLPDGGTLIFHHVSWEEYEELIEDLGAGYRARISYDHGRLEIMMPLPIHERQKEFISHLSSNSEVAYGDDQMLSFSSLNI
jgi:Uma2 family endonuclease